MRTKVGKRPNTDGLYLPPDFDPSAHTSGRVDATSMASIRKHNADAAEEAAKKARERKAAREAAKPGKGKEKEEETETDSYDYGDSDEEQESALPQPGIRKEEDYLLLAPGDNADSDVETQAPGAEQEEEPEAGEADPEHQHFVIRVKAGLGQRVIAIFRKIGVKVRFVKQIDGFDELAVASQSINPLIGAIAGAGVNAGALPFVIAGIWGLWSEAKENDEKIEMAKKLKNLTVKELVERTCETLKDPDFIERCQADESIPKTKAEQKARKKFEKNIQKHCKKLLKDKAVKNEEDLYHLTTLNAQLQALNGDIRDNRIEKWNHILGAEAMVGMAWGVGANVVYNVGGIVQAVEGASMATDIVMGAASLTAVGSLGPANAAMSIFGAVKCGNGIRKEIKQGIAKKRIRKQLDGYITPEAMKYARQYISTEQKYIAVDDITCGTATSLGQGLMVAGFILTLTGYGSGPGMACSLTGGVVTIVSAGVGAVTKYKHEKHQGDADKVNPEHRKNFNKLRLEAWGEAADASEMYPTLAKIAGRDMEDRTKDLARAKLYSLMFSVIKSKRFEDEDKSPVSKRMGKLLRTGRKNVIFKRTSLTKDIRECMEGIYEDEGYAAILDKSTRAEAIHALCEKEGFTPEYIRKGLQEGKREKAFARTLYNRTKGLVKDTPLAKTFIKKEGKHTVFDLDAYQEAMEKDDPSGKLRYEYEKLALETLIGRKKNAAKVHRADAVENLKTVANAFRIRRKQSEIPPPLDADWKDVPPHFGNGNAPLPGAAYGNGSSLDTRFDDLTAEIMAAPLPSIPLAHPFQPVQAAIPVPTPIAVPATGFTQRVESERQLRRQSSSLDTRSVDFASNLDEFRQREQPAAERLQPRPRPNLPRTCSEDFRSKMQRLNASGLHLTGGIAG